MNNGTMGDGALVRATIEIKRAATGLTETVHLAGYASKEALEAALNETPHTSAQEKQDVCNP